jgi:uncharacterized membrane protein HdeD (DUF308 family)
MNAVLAKNWWSLVIRGIVAILMGVAAFVWPGVTLAALVLLFGAYALLDGIVSMIGAVRAVEAHQRWGALVFEGVAGIAAAVITVLWPAITAFALVCIIAAWAILTGILEIAAAIRLRKHVAGEWLLALTGLVSVAFGMLLLVAPVAGVLAIALWVGIYLLVFGVLLVALGIRLKSVGPAAAQ